MTRRPDDRGPQSRAGVARVGVVVTRLLNPASPFYHQLCMRLLLFFMLTMALLGCSAKAAPNQPIPAAKTDVALASTSGHQTAVFAGGCFWGTQAVFERVKGVTATTVGYSGGSAS